MTRSLMTLLISFLCVLSVQSRTIPGAAAPTRDFLIGKTHYGEHPDFVPIGREYTTLRVPNNYIQKKTYEAFLKMHAAAKADGIRLVVTSASRNFWVQRYIWERKWQRSRVKEGPDRVLSVLSYSALCGCSRHHWGTDMDFNSPLPSYWETGEGKKTYRWLCENAHRFGFYQPYNRLGDPRDRQHLKGNYRTCGHKEEKWHWSYFPISNAYMDEYRKTITYRDLRGFLGDRYVEELDIIEKYVFGVAPSL